MGIGTFVSLDAEHGIDTVAKIDKRGRRGGIDLRLSIDPGCQSLGVACFKGERLELFYLLSNVFL